jgi:hypothetical protein
LVHYSSHVVCIFATHVLSWCMFDMNCVEFTVYTIHSVYNSQCIQFTVYTIHSVCNSQCIQFTVYAIHSVYNSQCIQFTVYAIHSVYNSQCMQFTVYTVHSVCNSQCMQFTVYAIHRICNTQCIQFSLLLSLWKTGQSWLHFSNQNLPSNGFVNVPLWVSICVVSLCSALSLLFSAHLFETCYCMLWI